MASNDQDSLKFRLKQAYDSGLFMSSFEDWVLNMHQNHAPLISAFGPGRAQELLADIRQLDQVKQFIARWEEDESAPPCRPAWAHEVKRGDSLTVRPDSLTRTGETGEVWDVINDEGVSLDFGCDIHGDEDEVPSIEFWKWEELVPLGE